MATNTGTLTAFAIKSAKPGKHFDGGGLYLHVFPNGSRYWRMKYRRADGEQLLSFGVYPEVSLAEARARRDQARLLIRDGGDPATTARKKKTAANQSGDDSFGAVASEWLGKQQASLAEATYRKAKWMLEHASALNSRPVGQIKAPEVLAILQKIEAAGHAETAHRVKQRVGQVLRYAVATGRADRDPTGDLRGALAPVVVTSHAALTEPLAIGKLLRALHGYRGQPETVAALRLAPLLFPRPGNLRTMEWSEIDFEAAEWRIPAHKMKMRDAHVVPLPTQALEILRDLHHLTGEGRYCFPGVRTATRPMSENTINAALRGLGFSGDTMTGHGFRAMASTRLNELGWPPDVIERQLAHMERNKIRAAYNRASYMAERRKMMQAWADHLDGLRDGATVTPLKAIPTKGLAA